MDNKSKILVVYFSATGNTKAVAQKIAKSTGGELFEIMPKVAYTSPDLNWHNSQSRSSLEMANPDARPELANKKANISEYDTIYIGFPIWWYKAPRIINSFIEEHDLTGKVLKPFATSGGSPIEPCVDSLRNTYPELNFQNGTLINER